MKSDAEKFGFVYCWYDRLKKMLYVGAHWGTPDDGYVCSSNWMKSAYKRRPHDFKFDDGRPTRRIVETTTDRRELGKLEQHWLHMIPAAQLGKKFYNLRRDNTGIGWQADDQKRMSAAEKNSLAQKGRTHSAATRRKLSECNKGRPLSPEHRRSISESTKGRIFSLEHRRNISEGRMRQLKGPLSIEHRRRVSDAQKGKTHSSETRRKMSEAQKGKTHTPETRRKLSETLKGKTHSPETRRKFSEWQKGRTLSPEHRRNISESNRGRPKARTHICLTCDDDKILTGADASRNHSRRGHLVVRIDQRHQPPLQQAAA